ncbi:MAG: hypothetical protein K0S48_1651 [Ramlibacter sp.]|jgi:hypothetical protein|nr:hypothetical protein [Ramlibacter sp.]
MSGEPKKPADAAADGKTPPAGAPRTGEGSGTALEALIRKRKQVEGPDPPDAAAQPPVRS